MDSQLQMCGWRKLLTDGLDLYETNPTPKRSDKIIAMLKNMNQSPKVADYFATAPNVEGCDGQDAYIVKTDDSEDVLVTIARCDAKLYAIDAELLRFSGVLGPLEEVRSCICPGHDVVSWKEKSSGYSWIAVNGTYCTCVVTTKNPIHESPANKNGIHVSMVLRGALSEMMLGDIPHQNFYPRNVAVVSSTPPSSLQQENGRRLAIEFLQAKLEEDASLSYKETEQIAICAFKLLLGRSFNPFIIKFIGWEFSNLHEAVLSMPKKDIMEALTNINVIKTLPPPSLRDVTN